MAVGSTFLTLTNDVLSRLRESSVTAVSANDYSTLVGKFVNEAKREVEDAWNWNRLRTTITVNTVADSYNYTLTGGGKRFRVIDAWNDTDDLQLTMMGMNQLNQRFYLGSATKGSPSQYGFNANSDLDPTVDVWPIPNAVFALRFNLTVPQTDLSADTDELKIQEMPFILGAWAKAISERGEDGGQNTSEAYLLYQQAVADAISQDAAIAPDETIWTAV